MKITKINMKNVGDKNPFYTVKWSDATPDKAAEIYSVIARISKSKISKVA
ncbi:hypothetical protein ACFQ1R_13070 [Mariniflexile jejuense]|uniref:Uncharacterized protein n=1 Tax=Mariniflexile jejuense TaxID=1173582 RepID=A0ABW3JKK6_9FLAO